MPAVPWLLAFTVIKRRWLIGLWLALILALLPLLAAAQDGAGQAGVVVVGPDGEVVTACVAADRVDNGLGLLDISGIPYEAATSNFGTTVCSVNGTGCPQDDCWCQCQGGGECVYWSLWQQVDGEWQYANVGAAQLPVNDGAIHGWVWGAGTPGDAASPPAVDLADLCAVAAEPAATAGVNEADDEAPTAAAAGSEATAPPAGLSSTFGIVVSCAVAFLLLLFTYDVWRRLRLKGQRQD